MTLLIILIKNVEEWLAIYGRGLDWVTCGGLGVRVVRYRLGTGKLGRGQNGQGGQELQKTLQFL
jgi:hypothetical protein